LQEGTADLPLKQKLGAIPGVERVVVDSDSRSACLVLRQNADAAAALASAAKVAPDHAIDVAFPPDIRERQRVRFIEIRREDSTEHNVAIHVTLEWNGRQHRGTGIGERSGPIEIRTAAAATLAALEFFLPDDVPLRLAGIKQVRAFDADMIVVSVHRTGSEPRNLVGAVVMGNDPLRGAAVAVLSALNRLLGNYLARP
jgi:hypothetical protein